MKTSVAAVLPAVLLGLGLAACSPGEGPTLPPTPTPAPTYVSVGGSYKGTYKQTIPDLKVSVTCSASTSVNQSNEVVVFLPLVLGAPCNQTMPFPLSPLVIAPDGHVPSFPQTVSAGQFVEGCTQNYTAVLTGGFSGNQFQLGETLTPVASNRTCPKVTVALSLDRQ